MSREKFPRKILPVRLISPAVGSSQAPLFGASFMARHHENDITFAKNKYHYMLANLLNATLSTQDVPRPICGTLARVQRTR